MEQHIDFWTVDTGYKSHFDFFNYSKSLQQAIKEKHPITPSYEYRVEGQLNIQYATDRSYCAAGEWIDQTIISTSPEAAAEKVLNGWAWWYRKLQPVKVEWLNNGPVVTQIIKPVY
jgi:hypothetical protein